MGKRDKPIKPDIHLNGRSSGLGTYELLLNAIENGALPPGSRLREADLALQFGISRTPVREALKRLEAQGLVSHQAHHGAVVAELDYGQITELYALREVLEAAAARLAAVHATEAEIEILERMVAHDRSLLNDPKELSRRNKLFHRQIHQSGRNRFLSLMLENMRTSLLLLHGTTLVAPNRAQQSLEEHQAIVDAIARHDPSEAEAKARQHIVNAFRTRLELRILSGKK
jgi:DNA-binding GntR family transcriptional regulator